MRQLDHCPVCETRDATLACEYNRFILRDDALVGEERRYDFSICHGCGVLYARRRPTGPAYVSLLRNFNESLGRAVAETDLVLFPGEVGSEMRSELRERAAAGVFVSEDTDLGESDYLAALLEDRKSTAPHVDILGALLEPRGNRVLEIRSKTGALLDQLRSWFDVEPYAMPIFETQKAVIEDAYGIPTSDLIDFESFAIPFEEEFDLIVSKHMFTHALDPVAYFAELRSRLREGGHIYLYAEPDDQNAMERRKSLFATMNPFHVQAFDRASLLRSLRRFGFEPLFVTHVAGNFACLARLDPTATFTPISEPALRKRVADYARWREYSVLSLPKSARAPYAGEWKAIERQALKSGVAERDTLGRITLKRAKKKAA